MPSIWFQRIALFLSLNWIFWQNYFNQLPSDIGDGIMHYFISNAVWSDPINLLDHWGKPFYILTSCLFTLLGMNGVILFNMLTFGLTVWIGWKLLNHFKIADLWKVALPFLLILTPEYAATMLSALTEPLFSLLFLAATFFLVKKKWVLFAIFIGILPFCRSEGQFAWVMAFVVLVAYRQWKAIPFIAIPFVIYGLIGWMALGDFLWYFTQSPYSMGNDIYGHGTWTHYFVSYKNYLGNHGLILLLFAFISLFFFLRNRNSTKDEWWFILLSSGMFFAVLAAHTIFWAKGLNGSMGLTRITTQALPSLFIVCFLLIDRFALLQALKRPLYPSLVVLVALSLYSFKKLKFEQDISLTQIALVEGAKDIYHNRKDFPGKFFYHHPLFAINMGFNSNRTNDRSEFAYFYPYDIAKAKLKMGDYLVWDGQFGPQEMGVAFETLASDSNFILVKEYPAQGPFERNGLYLFQKVPSSYKRDKGSVKEEKVKSETLTFTPNKFEFLEIKQFEKDKDFGYYHLKISSRDTLNLVVEDYAHIVYETYSTETQKEFSFYHQQNSALKVYLWNNEQKDLDTMKIEITRIKKTFPEPWKP